MQLFGQRNYYTGFYYIEGILISSNIKNSKSISFTISITTQNSFIAHGDAIKLGINCEFLKSKEGVDKNGAIPIKVMSDCSIGFMLPFTNTGLMEYFNQMDVQCPKILTKGDEQTYSSMYSILGVDFLSRYKIILQDHYMILEK